MESNKILYQVDSFTDEVFKGNPAGVMILEEPLEDELMQNIAMEMNLSETAFYMRISFTIIDRLPRIGEYRP